MFSAGADPKSFEWGKLAAGQRAVEHERDSVREISEQEFADDEIKSENPREKEEESLANSKVEEKQEHNSKKVDLIEEEEEKT